VDFSTFKKAFPAYDYDDGASQASTAIGSRVSSWNSIHDSIPCSLDSGSPKLPMSRQSSNGSKSDKNRTVVDVDDSFVTFVIQGLDDDAGLDQQLLGAAICKKLGGEKQLKVEPKISPAPCFPQKRGLSQKQLDNLCIDVDTVHSPARGFGRLIDGPYVAESKQSQLWDLGDFDPVGQAAVKFRKSYFAYKSKAQSLWSGTKQRESRRVPSVLL
jgi:hypothetical protein